MKKILLMSLALLAFSSAAFAQATVHGCCVDPNFTITRGEAQHWADDARRIAERNHREWNAMHRIVSQAPVAPEWQRYFAVLPVWVDAYSEAERKNGKFSWRKVGWVERHLHVWTDEEGEEHRVWRYRLPR